MNLTNHQNVTANLILLDIYKALEGAIPPYISLSGKAGSGKTTLTQELIDLLSEDYSIKATAPTHKATKILSANLNGISSSTIHSFLKLKLKPDFDTGFQILVEDWSGGKSSSDDVDILIVDEGSMISSEMFGYIENAISRGKMKVVLFVGDSMQLKPVEDNDESIYDRLVSHELTHIVRQAQDNPIIKESTWIRYMIEEQNFLPLDKLFTKSKNKIDIFTNRGEFLEDYLNNTTEDKIVCSFTNAVVDQYNHFIRGKIKGEDIPYIVVGDELIFQDAFTEGKDKILYANNDIVTVSTAQKAYDDKLKLEYWFITVVNNEPFKIVDVGSMDIWNKHLAKLRDNANKATTKADRSRLWAFYFETNARYANVKYTYASTLHKLQGSTYEDVYFDFRSLIKHTHDMDNVYRLIYVALTRASSCIKVLK